MGWGGQPERLESSYYFFFYTLGASLPLLICIIYIYGRLGRSFFIYNDQLGGLIKGWFFFIFLDSIFGKITFIFISSMTSKGSCRGSSLWFNNFGWGFIKVGGLWRNSSGVKAS